MDQLASLLKPSTPTQRKNLKADIDERFYRREHISSTKSSQIVEKFAAVFNAEGYLLPAPLIVDKKEIAQAISNDSHVRYVMDLSKKSELAVVSIGALTHRFRFDQEGRIFQIRLQRSAWNWVR